MITSEAVRVALTAVFAGVCVWYLGILGRVVTRLSRKLAVISVGLHVLMCLAMISMLWPWGTRIPVIALVTVFTAGAAWFAGLALFRVRGTGHGLGHDLGHSLGHDLGHSLGHDLGHSLGHAAGRFAGWYQAGMMGAMVWMAVAMSAATSPAGLLAAGSAPAASGGMDGMSGMSMGTTTAGTTTGSGTSASSATLSVLTLGHPVGWVGTVCLALCVVFFAAGAWFAVAALRALAAPDMAGHRTGSTVHDGMGALMAAGMGVALLAMA